MSDAQIIETIDMILDGRALRSKPRMHRENGAFAVYANVYNADGMGFQDTMLACFDDVNTAVRIKNLLAFQ